MKLYYSSLVNETRKKKRVVLPLNFVPKKGGGRGGGLNHPFESLSVLPWWCTKVKFDRKRHFIHACMKCIV